MTKHRIYLVSVASVYPHYIAKAERKGRTKTEVDEVICWLTGHSQEKLDVQLAKNASPLAIADYRSYLRRPRGGHPRTHHAGNPLPGQTDRRTLEGSSDGENPAKIARPVGSMSVLAGGVQGGSYHPPN